MSKCLTCTFYQVSPTSLGEILHKKEKKAVSIKKNCSVVEFFYPEKLENNYSQKEVIFGMGFNNLKKNKLSNNQTLSKLSLMNNVESYLNFNNRIFRIIIVT